MVALQVEVEPLESYTPQNFSFLNKFKPELVLKIPN